MHQVRNITTGYEADLAACRALLRTGSRTFYAASYLLPRRIREPATALYAFCRLADDVIDLGGDGVAGLNELQDRLSRAYAGKPRDIPADRAFAVTVERFDIPRALPEALLEGFAWDASGRTYDDLAGVQAYAARVAGTVGAMMALLMGARTGEDLARATDLGIAMQMTNIARDVGEDARNGRLYLPRQWMRDVGLDPDAWLQDPVYSRELGSVIERLLAVAEDLYARASLGIARLPTDCRPGIFAARYLYAEIGHELARRGYDSVSQRAVVPAAKKLRLLSRAVAAAPIKRSGKAAAAVDEAGFLVAAVVGNNHWYLPDSNPVTSNVRWWDLHGQAVMLVELLVQFERRDMDRRDQLHSALTGRSGGQIAAMSVEARL
jgi:15-cis-phytoene synthase